jgi:hypothetical protein
MRQVVQRVRASEDGTCLGSLWRQATHITPTTCSNPGPSTQRCTNHRDGEICNHNHIVKNLIRIGRTLVVNPDYCTRHPPSTRVAPINFIPIIDDASNSPLVLMLVCKHWYTTVTGIWASLKLGTRTPRDAVTRKLERNQWLLDIVVDTEIDRGDFTPSEAAYEAIFAAIEATSRWRSLVVETFPGQTDLPEHLVNRGLQRCSNATMSRLKDIQGEVRLRDVAPPRPSLAHSWHHSQSGAYHSGNKFSKCHIIPCSCIFPHLSFRQSPLPRYFGDAQSSRPSPSPTSTGNTYRLSSLPSHLCR